MNNWMVIGIIVAIGFGYMQNRDKVHEMIGIDPPKTASTDDVSKVDGINFVKLNNIDSLNTGVHLMSASWCGYCKQLRRLLTEQNIPFTEYNVEADALVAEFLQKNNIDNGVPITVIGGDIVYGYDAEKLERTFKQNGFEFKGI